MPQLSINSTYSATTRWVLIAIIIVVLLVAAWAIRGILLLTLASVILVVLFTMPIRFLIRRGMRRGPAIILSLLFIAFLVVGLVATAFPELFRQFAVLTTEFIPRGIQTLVDRYLTSGAVQEQFPFLRDVDFQNLLNTLSGQLATAIGQFGVTVLPVLGGVADTILSILIVIFLSIYLLADPQMHQEGLIRLFPVWYRYRVREIIARLDYTLRGWLRATIISMAFVGVATWLGLALLGIEQAAALGVLAGLLSFIPNFGPLVALIPSIAVGILQTPESVGWIVVIIYGVSFVQSQIFTPLLVAGSIKLPAVMVLLGQIIAGAFLGFLGIMLAVPITAILTVLVQEIYIKDILGDTSVQDESAPEEALIPDGV